MTWSVSDSTNTIEDVPKELERTVMPFVSVKDAPGFLKFLGEVFGAEPAMEAAKEPSGKVRDTPERQRRARRFLPSNNKSKSCACDLIDLCSMFSLHAIYFRLRMNDVFFSQIARFQVMIAASTS